MRRADRGPDKGFSRTVEVTMANPPTVDDRWRDQAGTEAENHARSSRMLIVNADDFGRTPAVNRGVILAHQQGIVTSASLMVRWPSSDEAASYASAHEDLSLGIHIDLGEWRLSSDRWENVYQIVSLSDRESVVAEVANQLGRFHKLMDRSPTHIDSHQHVHRSEPVSSVIADFGRQLGVPVRGAVPDIRYCGDFYGQSAGGSPLPNGISPDALISIFDRLEPGVTELSCHPGEEDDLDSAYAFERRVELSSLCDPAVRRALEIRDIALVSYRDLQAPSDRDQQLASSGSPGPNSSS